MARYNPTVTVKEALASYMNNPVFQEANGKLVINSSTSKRTGALFLYRGKVYSIQVKGYSARLFTRLVNSGLLDDDQIAELQRKYGRDQDNPIIIDYAAQKMMITAEQAGEFIREYSLGAWDDLFSWIGVKVEWKNGLATENTTFSNRPVALERLVDLGEKRAKYLDEIASGYTVNREDLNILRFQRIDDAYNPGGLEGDVMAYATGEYNAFDLARVTGVPVFNLVSTIYQLWQADKVQVWYGEFKLKRAEIEQMHEDTTSYGTARPVIRTDTRNVDVEPETQLVIAELSQSKSAEPEEVELEELYNDPETQVSLADLEAEAFPAEEVAAPISNNAHNADDIPPLSEEDVEYESSLPGEPVDEDEEDFQAEEYQMAQQREDEEDGVIPLEDDFLKTETEESEVDEEEDTIPAGDFIEVDEEDEELEAGPVDERAPETLDEFFGGGLVVPLDQENANPSTMEKAEDPVLVSLVAQVAARRDELRSTTLEAADRMAECDELIAADQQDLAALQDQLSAVQQRISENEDARSQWEAVYDEASAKYSSFQKQLALLQDNS